MKSTHLYSIAIAALLVIAAAGIAVFQNLPAQVSQGVVVQTTIDPSSLPVTAGKTVRINVAISVPAGTKLFGADMAFLAAPNNHTWVQEVAGAPTAFDLSMVSDPLHIVRATSTDGGVAGGPFASVNVTIKPGVKVFEFGLTAAQSKVFNAAGQSIPFSAPHLRIALP